jgi:hypothetical protein
MKAWLMSMHTSATASGRQVLDEGVDRAGILALGDEQNAAAC